MNKHEQIFQHYKDKVRQIHAITHYNHDNTLSWQIYDAAIQTPFGHMHLCGREQGPVSVHWQCREHRPYEASSIWSKHSSSLIISSAPVGLLLSITGSVRATDPGGRRK